MYKSSLDKIIMRYFAVVTKEQFTWKGIIFTPKPLQISPLLLRGFICPPNCGGCCPRFSLEYLPGHEEPSEDVILTSIEFKNERKWLLTDTQSDNNHHCKYLDKNGRCSIYSKRPFSCDFELIRPLIYINPNRPNVLTSRLFGRGWNMLRIDNHRGTLCKMTDPNEESINEVIRKIRRLEVWCNYFNLENKCSDIIRWVENIRNFTKLNLTHIII